MPTDTIPGRLFAQADKQPTAPAYFEKINDGWTPTSYRGYADQIRQAARALIALGHEPNGKICILGFNCPEWSISDLACIAAGGVPAGIYDTCSPEEIAYILQHSEAFLVVIEDKVQWEKVKEVRGELPDLKWVVTMKKSEVIEDDMVMSWEDFLAKGNDVPDSAIDERLENIDPSDAATFIYTSGTTGPPKAVMLSHENLTWTAQRAVEMVDMTNNDINLSYLPLSHIAEQMFSLHAPATAGSQVYYCEARDKVPDNLKEVRPTVVFGVPRVWEKLYAGVTNKLKDAPPMKQKLVGWATNVGRAVTNERHHGREPGGFLALQYKFANKLIFSKLKPALGMDRARLCVSGAAPISPEVIEFFNGLDLPIYEVYGQSEDCGPTSFNLPGRTRVGSVGQAVEGVEVKIAEDDEILVRGPNVFLGYYKDEGATNDTIIDGWLHSGDLGKFDEDGFLSIIGRKKDIIITAGGKNIAPKNIEAALKGIELVSQAVVIGDRRKFLSALVALDPEASAAFAAANNITGNIHEHEAVIKAVQAGVDELVNPRFARVEHIRKFKILPRELDTDNKELTPTLKIKRRIVNQNWADLIESMYTD